MSRSSAAHRPRGRSPSVTGDLLLRFAIDILAIATLAYGVYYRRHRRTRPVRHLRALQRRAVPRAGRDLRGRGEHRRRLRAVRRALDRPAAQRAVHERRAGLLLRRAGARAGQRHRPRQPRARRARSARSRVAGRRERRPSPPARVHARARGDARDDPARRRRAAPPPGGAAQRARLECRVLELDYVRETMRVGVRYATTRSPHRPRRRRCMPLARHPLDALRDGLAELDASTALRDRVDIKYVAGLDVFAALAERLAATHRALEIGGRRRFAYATTYFDTPDLGVFRDHAAAAPAPLQVPARARTSTPARRVFEVKARGARGATHDVAARAARAGRARTALLGFVSRRRAARVRSRAGAGLAPVLDMRFRAHDVRRAGARRAADLRLRPALRGPRRRARLTAGAVILESKSRTGGRSPTPCCAGSASGPWRAAAKYCLGIALTRPGADANPYRRLLRRHFEETA